MLKKIKLEDAVGTKLAHDMTEIRPGEFKGAAFHRGHTVCNEDLCRLHKMGKNQLYVIDLNEDEIHEDQAAAILADALAGDGIIEAIECPERRFSIGVHWHPEWMSEYHESARKLFDSFVREAGGQP